MPIRRLRILSSPSSLTKSKVTLLSGSEKPEHLGRVHDVAVDRVLDLAVARDEDSRPGQRVVAFDCGLWHGERIPGRRSAPPLGAESQTFKGVCATSP